MGRNKGEPCTIRILIDTEKEIDAYCAKHRIENRSEFFQFAAAQVLRPEIEDPKLVFSSLKQLHDKINTVSRQQEILFSFTGHLFRYMLSYHSEIPTEFKETAARSAMERYERVFKSFQDNLKSTPAMFESLLADYFEEG